MQDIAITVLGITALLALVSLLPPVATRLNLPYTVLLAGVGIALGGLLAGLGESGLTGISSDLVHGLSGLGMSAEAFLVIFLPTLLFETALTLDVRRLLDDVWPILLLAVVAVLVATFVVGAAMWAATGVALSGCLLLGAIIATTDPVAVVGIFRDLGAPRRLGILVEGESLFNDAAAIALFTLIVAIITGQTGGMGVMATIVGFLKGFAGGIVFGYLAARGACALMAPLRGFRLAEITVTVALAYLVYIIADRYLEISGVVAVVTSALTIGTLGPTRMTPSTWDSLVETWEQLGFWANSLIFLLAAMLVPRILQGVGWVELGSLAVLIVSALVARAVVVYGMLPLLTVVRLAQRVEPAYKLVILWGGLRGAVSLALALAVTEKPGIPPDIKHFIAWLATGFVLFTLIVNGLTLRPLLKLLKLDRLAPADIALRDRALATSLANIRHQVDEIARAYEIDPSRTHAVTKPYDDRLHEVQSRTTSQAGLTEADLVTIGLLGLAAFEERLYLRHFRERLISRRIIQLLSAEAGRLIDGAKSNGAKGYETAWRRSLDFPHQFRTALLFHRYLNWATPLANLLSDRFETMVVTRLVLHELVEFNATTLMPLLGEAPGSRLSFLLTTRLKEIETALAALKLQYPEYAGLLEERYLARAALRLEEAAYHDLFSSAIIGQEVFNDLNRGLIQTWHQVDRRPSLDLGLALNDLVARVPMFMGLEPRRLAEIAKLLRPRLALPGERIVERGDRGDAMYFISSGAVEVDVQPHPVRLGSGDFFGELALITNQPRTANVTALGFCQLLELPVTDFQRLLDADQGLAQRINAVARARLTGALSTA